MKITIHQPEHLPWIGLLDKISKVDIFVVMDEVNFRKNYFQNRNKVRTKDSWTWLTIPVEKHNHKPINEIKISYNTNWQKNYLGLLKENYKNSKYFKYYYLIVEKIIQRNCKYLMDINYPLIEFILKAFDIHTKIVKMSDLINLPKVENGSDKCLEICKYLKATTYLSGVSGKDYLDLKKFKQANINVEFHQFFHPLYKQIYKGFEVGLSSLDLLFNYGEEAKYILNTKGKESLKQILNKYDYKNSKILEVFGGKGKGHLTGYGNETKSLEIWELDTLNYEECRRKYPNAHVVNTNSIEMIKTTNKKFDIIILDPPATITYQNILPQITKLIDKKGILIFRAIKQSYNNNPNVKPTKSLEYFDELFSKEFTIKNRYRKIREYYFLEDWLYNFIYELERK